MALVILSMSVLACLQSQKTLHAAEVSSQMGLYLPAGGLQCRGVPYPGSHNHTIPYVGLLCGPKQVTSPEASVSSRASWGNERFPKSLPSCKVLNAFTSFIPGAL